MTGKGELMRRIPRIKFPQRHPMSSSSSSSVSAPQTKAATSTGYADSFSRSSSDVPAPPKDMSVGGKASLQPKRTPVTDREIEAILLGGCF